MTFQRKRGFTLIELMVVVAVIAVLAAIALPIFNEQVRKSRRSEATSGLNQLALLQERWRANNPTYGTMDQIGSGAVTSTFYTFTLTGDPTATSYALNAAPAGAQTADTKCGTFTYAFNAGTVTKSAASGDCW